MIQIRRAIREVEEVHPRCGLCHQSCERPRYIVGIGTRFLHEACEMQMRAMGYDVQFERRVGSVRPYPGEYGGPELTARNHGR